MGIDAKVERAVNSERFALIADRLGDGEHMPFVERHIERRSAMPRGAKHHSLRGHARIGLLGVVGGDEPRDIDQLARLRPSAGERADVAGCGVCVRGIVHLPEGLRSGAHCARNARRCDRADKTALTHCARPAGPRSVIWRTERVGSAAAGAMDCP